MTDMVKGEKNSRFSRFFLLTLAMILLFAELCKAFMKVLVLANFDSPSPICLERDASGFAIAGFISQQQDDSCDAPTSVLTPHGKGQWHLVAYWSQRISSADWNYAIGNQEMLAIVMFCCH